MKKVKKKYFKDFVKSTCTSSDHDEDTCKISEGLVKNYRRSCAHKVLTINSEKCTTNHAPRKAEYYVPLLFFEKAGDKKNVVEATSHLMSTLTSIKQVIFSYKKFLNFIY